MRDLSHSMEAEREKLKVKSFRGFCGAETVLRYCAGVADSGKISTLKELTRGLKGNPLLLAPTNSAVEVLKQDGVPNSQTVASFLLNPPQLRIVVVG